MADLHSALERLDAAIERKIQALNFPGLAIGITNRERLLFVGHYGLANRETQQPTTPETLFQIGSISKAFTCFALLQLQEQGLLTINDPITKHLPWFKVQSDFAPICLRHLMSHTAGIINGADATSAAATETWNLRHTRATASPGEMFHYSNTGYKALGLVLESILQQPISTILQERPLQQLAMAASETAITQGIRSRLAVGYQGYFDDRPHLRDGPLTPAPWLESDTADGSISSTAEDMCCYLRALLNRGVGLLAPESFKQMITPAIPTGDGLHGQHYGLGLFIDHLGGDQVIGHSGGMVGYLADLLADLDAGIGIIAMTNSPYNPQSITHMAWELLVTPQNGGEIPEILAADPYKVKNADDYVGQYHLGGKTFTLTSQNDHLHLEFEGDVVRLEPSGPDVFLVPHPTFKLFPLRLERQLTKGAEKANISAATHGPDVYLPAGVSNPPEAEVPLSWHAYPGHYRSHNPWLSNFRVVLRKGGLYLIYPQGDEEPLIQINDSGYFRVGAEPCSPEFIRFETIIDGLAQFVNLSGGAYCRTFTP